jgi:hypothetical protein
MQFQGDAKWFMPDTLGGVLARLADNEMRMKQWRMVSLMRQLAGAYLPNEEPQFLARSRHHHRVISAQPQASSRFHRVAWCERRAHVANKKWRNWNLHTDVRPRQTTDAEFTTAVWRAKNRASTSRRQLVPFFRQSPFRTFRQKCQPQIHLKCLSKCSKGRLSKKRGLVADGWLKSVRRRRRACEPC